MAVAFSCAGQVSSSAFCGNNLMEEEVGDVAGV